MFFCDLFEDLKYGLTYSPNSFETESLKVELVDFLESKDLLPSGVSKENFISLMNPSLGVYPRLSLFPPKLSGVRGSAFFCNFVTFGEGGQFPVIILPRLIPILLIPIPRVYLHWDADEGFTSCGGLVSGKGFIASGAQTGTALGFWGIGFSIFLPPVREYGFIGYALFATATAENVELWPPNEPPVVSAVSPLDGAVDVSVSTSEIRFRIEDSDGDRMRYSVTTDPDIGSGSGNYKSDGVYSIPISGLEDSTKYTWTVELTDGVNDVVEEFGFFTEMVPFNPFDEGWQYRKKVTINHDKVDEDLVDFPVLVSVVDYDLRDKAQGSGDDILFMDGEGVANKLYHEIESYEGSSGELIAWLNVPTVSDNKDTVLYMYYGNPGCSNQQFPEKVWDSNYCGVWHLDDFLDSTHNDNDGTNHGTDDFSGKVGIAKDFIRANKDYIALGDMSEPADSSITTATFEMWINIDNLGKDNILFFKANSGDYNPDRLSYGWYIGTTGKIGVNIMSGTWYPEKNRIGINTNEPHVLVDSWQYVSVAVDLSEMKANIYYNGEEKENTITIYGTPPAYFYDVTVPEELGRMVWEAFTSRYNGAMDEIRISKVCRSGEWISTQYNNQNDPSSFYSIDPEESAP